MYGLFEIGNNGGRGQPIVTFTHREDSFGWVAEFARGAGYNIVMQEEDHEDDGVDFMLAKGMQLRQFAVDRIA